MLARIEAVNPAVNAIVTLAADQAHAAAAVLDDQAARGEFAGPLHGLPIAIKDLAETAGIRTTYGSPIFADHVPSFDAPHVALAAMRVTLYPPERVESHSHLVEDARAV